jgi:hypothetical protein
LTGCQKIDETLANTVRGGSRIRNGYSLTALKLADKYRYTTCCAGDINIAVIEFYAVCWIENQRAGYPFSASAGLN